MQCEQDEGQKMIPEYLHATRSRKCKKQARTKNTSSMTPPTTSKKKRPGSAKARNRTQGNTGKAVTSRKDDICDTCSCKLPPHPKYNRNTSVKVVTSRIGHPIAVIKLLLPRGASSPMVCCRIVAWWYWWYGMRAGMAVDWGGIGHNRTTQAE